MVDCNINGHTGIGSEILSTKECFDYSLFLLNVMDRSAFMQRYSKEIMVSGGTVIKKEAVLGCVMIYISFYWVQICAYIYMCWYIYMCAYIFL